MVEYHSFPAFVSMGGGGGGLGPDEAESHCSIQGAIHHARDQSLINNKRRKARRAINVISQQDAHETITFKQIKLSSKVIR